MFRSCVDLCVSTDDDNNVKLTQSDIEMTQSIVIPLHQIRILIDWLEEAEVEIVEKMKHEQSFEEISKNA